MIRTLVYRDNKLALQDPPLDQIPALRLEPNVMLWMDMDSPTDEEARRVMAGLFGFHPLTIEDCLLETPLPKIEEYDDYLYLVMHPVDYTHIDKFTTTELDLLLGANFLVTYHRQTLRSIQATIEDCVRHAGTPVRGPDRLVHNVLDRMVDAYKPALHALRHEVERIEDLVLDPAATDLAVHVLEVRKDLVALRQATTPQREIVRQLATGATRWFRPKLLPYLRDLHDELLRIEDLARAWSDQLVLSFRIYLNRSAHEANSGIRVLTALTAVLLPAVIVGGWYGMNFPLMPEISAAAGYPLAAAATLLLTACTLWFLRRHRLM